MKKRLGFTLIEVMVVMAIIAVLATAGISSYGWYFAKSTQVKADIELADKVRATLEFASDHNGRYPYLPSNPLAPPPNDRVEFENYIALNSLSPGNPIAALFDIIGVPKTFALSGGVFAHPAGARNICARKNAQGVITFDAPCEIVYVRSGTGASGQKAWFFWAAGAVTTDAAKTSDFHAIDMTGDVNASPRPITYGTIKGNLPAINNLTISTTTIEDYNNNANPSVQLVTVVKASGLSDLSFIPGGVDPASITIPPTTPPPPPTIPPFTTPPLPPTIPNTTIPITTPPVSEYPYPTESSTSDYYYPTSSWEESTTGYESSTSEEQPTMPPFTTGELPTTAAPSTTGGSYCFFLDLFCPESQYCDDNTCRPNSEAEAALSTSIPSTSTGGGDLYCTWTIFAPFTPGNCMSYSTGLPTGEQCWIFDFTCTLPGGEGLSTTELYCGGFGDQYNCESNGCYWDYYSCSNLIPASTTGY